MNAFASAASLSAATAAEKTFLFAIRGKWTADFHARAVNRLFHKHREARITVMTWTICPGNVCALVLACIASSMPIRSTLEEYRRLRCPAET